MSGLCYKYTLLVTWSKWSKSGIKGRCFQSTKLEFTSYVNDSDALGEDWSERSNKPQWRWARGTSEEEPLTLDQWHRTSIVVVGEKIETMTRGGQRDRDRERAAARAPAKGKAKDDGLTADQRRERDAKALQEKTAKKAAAAAAGGGDATSTSKAPKK